MAGLLMAVVSCGNDDEPRQRNSVFTVNTPMINHMVNASNGEVLGMSRTHNKLTIDTIKHTATLELNYEYSGNKTLVLQDITAMPKRLGFYELRSPSNAQFGGYVDFNESSIRYNYTTADGLRIISTIAEVFFLKTLNTITYDDTTQTTVMENTMYQFTLSPENKTAIVKVMGILHAKDWNYFINITGNSVPLTITRNGYTIAGQNIKTNATYRTHRDSTTVTPAPYQNTDKYPFKTFSAEVDLENDSIVANYMMGASATVVATGRTYPDYTAY